MKSLDRFLINDNFDKRQLFPVSGIYHVFKDLSEDKPIIEPKIFRYLHCLYQGGSFVLTGKLIGYSLAQLVN